MAVSARLALASAALLAAARLAAAEPPAAEPEANAERALSFTISGGVSLGAYQAGFNYLAVEALKRNRDRLRLALITGASAGSGNGLITAIEYCQPEQPFPTRGLGWNVWLQVGYQRLFVEEEVTATNVFTRAPLEESMEFARAALQAGLLDGCEVVLGFSVTRLRPDEVQAQRNLQVPRQAKKFAVRIRGRGRGAWPRIDNYVDPYSNVGSAALPFIADPQTDADHDHNWHLLRDLVFASSSFPVAFRPVALRQCMTLPFNGHLSDANDRCVGNDTEELFVDGGVFDNNPLRYAYQLSNLGLRRAGQGKHGWRDLRQPVDNGAARAVDDVIYIYLDPDTRPYPEVTEEAERQHRRLVPLMTDLLADFIQSARAKELSAIVDENPELLRKARLTTNRYSTVSRHLGAFLGFFDREFRRFDFYLGMYDAYHEVATGTLAFDIARPALYDFGGLSAAQARDLPADWKPFACLRGWLDSDAPALRAACAGPALREFRILIQATLDRTYSDCRALDAASRDFSAWPHHCRLAARGEAPPLIDGVKEPDDRDHWRRDDESPFDHLMRSLEDYRFTFTDLGLRADQAKFGRVRIRRKFLKMLKWLADAQDNRADRLILLTAGRSVVNRIAYEPPRNWWYFVAGSYGEVGASVLPFDWNRSFARLNLALTAKGLTTVITEERFDTQLSLLAGPELQLLPITTRLVQPIVGARVGYQFGTADDFEIGRCDREEVDDVRSCSQLVVQAYGAVALLERLRIQLTAEFFPAPPGDFDDVRNIDLLLGIGYQFF